MSFDRDSRKDKVVASVDALWATGQYSDLTSRLPLDYIHVLLFEVLHQASNTDYYFLEFTADLRYSKFTGVSYALIQNSSLRHAMEIFLYVKAKKQAMKNLMDFR